MQADPSSRKPNRLIHETSPYLLQHAYNPVEWYPWGEEALRLAASTNRPILLSIGYSSCHWCHVMERESFESETIGALMNRHFVCIKVDREERPDLDEIYMQATLAMNHGQGGWPMTVFLTPDQKPIFAGTYFPPEDRWGRPGFGSVLKKIAELWEKDPEGLREQAAHLTARLTEELKPAAPSTVGLSEMEAAVTEYRESFDSRFGGFGRAPKFPPATGLSFLLHWHHRTGDAGVLEMATKTLDAMAEGGIYDHIGGGFARYSTDERWLVPHFEKMLYDNALLARVYVEAFQVTHKAHYRDVARDILDYILREMTSPDGGFYSATDADSEGVEGKFFVWTPDEIRAAVSRDEDARRLCAYYDITPHGNWEHKNIPNRMTPLETVARGLGLSEEELLDTVRRLRPLLYQARRQRVPPGLDDKILTAWNGMMISAMAEAARVFSERRYLDPAVRTADFLLRTMTRPDGGLLRTYRAGKAHVNAYLEDYAYLAEGLIDLYEAGGSERFLTEAVRLAERILTDFRDSEAGGFFTTAKDHEQLLLRSREGPDGATPSGNAVAAAALVRLSFHYGREEFRRAAVDAIRAYGRQIARYPRAFAKSLIVTDLLLQGPVELGFLGGPDDPELQRLQAEVARIYLPNRIIAHRAPAQTTLHPLMEAKDLVGGRPALYVCRNFACQRPVTDPAEVVHALASWTRKAEVNPHALRGSRLGGHATAEATAQFASRAIIRSGAGNWLARGFTTLGATGLTVSRLGFGTYRARVQEQDHRAALVAALREGCNLVDTSTNYMDGDSERLVGTVLKDLCDQGELARREVIVVSKIGYVQGENLKVAEAKERSGQAYPELVKYAEGVWHCIHPQFLADQLEHSLDRLRLEALDVCLLHNPEYFLSDERNRGAKNLVEIRQEFYRRIEAAFEFFETQVAAGKIRYYGVSSNTLASDAGDSEATSLSHFLLAADRVTRSRGVESHHFRVVQCPMNLLERGAYSVRNTGEDHRQTVLELVQKENLALLVNRPLNAMPARGGGMQRLAEFPSEPQRVDFEDQRKKVASLEQEYRRSIAPAVQASGQGVAPGEFFNWSEELARVRPQIQGLEHWEQIESQMIAPHVNQVVGALTRQLTGETAERWEAWRERYVPELVALLGELRREATECSLAKTAGLVAKLDPLLPESRRKESLSRKALWVLRSTPGVTCVLNGMRSVPYVRDSLAVLSWEPFAQVDAVYRCLE
jgi:hypothetical protein